MNIINSKVIVKRQVSLNLEALDWDLYSTIDGTKGVAESLNKQVSIAINESPDRETAFKLSLEVLEHHKKYGAADSEGIAVLNKILDIVYGID
jgi:hypothetical protein